MKDLFSIIKESLTVQEALKISKSSKIEHQSEYEKNGIMDPEDLPYPEVKALDYNGEEVVILGKPFQKKGDDNYKFTCKYIKRKGYTIYYSFDDLLDDGFDDLLNDLAGTSDDAWFVYAKFEHKGTVEVDCYVYGPEGVYVENLKH